MIEDFKAKFNFRPEMSLYLGIEREYFLSEGNTGELAPKAKNVLDVLLQDEPSEKFGYELSACQIESKDGPHLLENLYFQVDETHRKLAEACLSQGLKLLYSEVAPEDMPLDIFPDPTGRYQDIAKKLPEEVLRAACRVVGTHVHVGMPDHETALRVYNRVIQYFSELSAIGDNSHGQRMALYRKMAPDSEPRMFRDWEHFYYESIENGYNEDPRSLYSLVRISVHGTLEFRMFGTTSDTHRVIDWARICYNLCREAMV